MDLRVLIKAVVAPHIEFCSTSQIQYGDQSQEHFILCQSVYTINWVISFDLSVSPQHLEMTCREEAD